MQAGESGGDARLGPSAVDRFAVDEIVSGVIEIIIQFVGDAKPSLGGGKKLSTKTGGVGVVSVEVTEEQAGEEVVPETVPAGAHGLR